MYQSVSQTEKDVIEDEYPKSDDDEANQLKGLKLLPLQDESDGPNKYRP